MGKENYLDHIPKHNILFPSERNEKGHVEVIMKNNGLFNRIAQLFFKRPKISRIELDDFGSLVWNCMDGESSIYEIGKKVKEVFGADAEPLYERLSQYCKILHNNKFIVYVDMQKK